MFTRFGTNELITLQVYIWTGIKRTDDSSNYSMNVSVRQVTNAMSSSIDYHIPNIDAKSLSSISDIRE